MQVQRLRDALTEFGPERCSLGAGPIVEQLCSQLRQEVRSVVHAGNVCKWVPPPHLCSSCMRISLAKLQHLPSPWLEHDDHEDAVH